MLSQPAAAQPYHHATSFPPSPRLMNFDSTTPNTLNEQRPSSRQASSTSPSSSHIRQHTPNPTVAQPLPPASHSSTHLPLPQLSLPQLSLHQALLQPHPTTSLLPPARPLLHWLHGHWHSPQRTQSQSQTQATPKQHPRISRTLPTILAFSQQHPPLHHHSAYIS